LVGGPWHRVLGMDFGFGRRALLTIHGFFFVEWQRLWPRSEGAVPDEEHSSELRYLGASPAQ
jgi:hypothetical protein